MFKIKRSAKGLMAGLALGITLLCSSIVAVAYETVDVMVLYTSAAKNNKVGAVGTYINHLVSASNTYYRDSNMDIRIRLVHTAEMNLSGTSSVTVPGLDTLRKSTTVKNLRTKYGADVVTLLNTPTSSACGLGYLAQGSNGRYASSARANAYNMVGVDCQTTAFAHEIGHNIGLHHSRKQDVKGGVFDYGVGYGVDGAFTTVMAYPSAFGTRVRVGRFSDPSVKLCAGYACGVDKQYSNSADAVSAVNQMSKQIAAWYPTVVEGGSPGGGTECTTPAKPLKPVASNIGASSYAIQWVAASGASSYQVQRWDADNRAWQNYSKTSQTQANISGETRSTVYSRVIGINECGAQGAASDWVTVALNSGGGTPGNGCTPPAAPATPTVSNIGLSSYTLAWSAVSNADQYLVQRRAAGSSTWVDAITTEQNSVSITGITHATDFARVVAINSCGEQGAFSASATIILEVPDGGGGETNIITNGGFEAGSLTGWLKGFDGSIYHSDVRRSGQRAMHVYNRNNWYDGAMQELGGKVAAYTNYSFSAWVRMRSGVDTVQARVWYYDDAGPHWLEPFGLRVDTNWSELSGNINISNPQGRVTYVRLYIFGPQPRQEFFVDDVSLTKQ